MGCMTTDENNSTRRDLQRQCAEADALAALDEHRYGDVRRLLKTGKASPVVSGSSVLAFPGS